MPVPNQNWGDTCKYEFWPMAKGSQNLFVDPKTRMIGYNWDVGATIQTDLKMAVPENWKNFPIIAISWDEECEESGYRYQSWYEMKEDIDNGKIKGTPDAISNLEKMFGLDSDGDPSMGVGSDPEDRGKFPLWAKILLGVVAFKVLTD